MKLSSLLWFSVVTVTPILGQGKKFPIRTINDIILDEERFVLFNSRRLTGECPTMCVPGPPKPTPHLTGDTAPPTISPTISATSISTSNPTGSPTNSLTGGPTRSPTIDPTGGPTDSPTIISTGAPTGSTTNNPTGGPTGFPTDNPTRDPTGSPITTPTRGPTESPTNTPTRGPTESPTNTPTSGPTGSPTNNPTRGPTDFPTENPTEAPTEFPDYAPPPPDLDCDSLVNLGDGFSEATGNPHYSQQCYPPVIGLNANNLPGRDDSVAVFVGGNYIGVRAAEVEGNMVVLGDLEVKSTGPGNFVSVGAGTHVLPNSGGDCIIVGGDISAQREIQVFNQVSSMYCDIVYRGNSRNSHQWRTNGQIRHEPNYDLTHYEQMKYVLAKKSQYWKTLPSTGQVKLKDGTTKYQCSDDDDIQVFNIRSNEHDKLNTPTAIVFSNSCEDKTVLINVHGTGDIGVNAAGTIFKNKQGYGANGFSTCLTQSILYNFPDATNVDIGNGKTSEFHGSLLVSGNLKLSTSGHSGRTMVLGDIYHDSNTGSEFHSYQFAPPTPLPDPEDICEIPEDWRSIGTEVGTYAPAPTESPTPPAAIHGCVAIPQSKLPDGSWETSDDQCRQCQGPNPVSWWPCNLGTPICQGECIFNNSAYSF